VPPPPAEPEEAGPSHPPPPLLEREHQYSEILKVEYDVSDSDLRKRYRKPAGRYHPDKQKDAEAGEAAVEKFKQVSRAYKVLSDPKKRQAYNDAISLLWEVAA